MNNLEITLAELLDTDNMTIYRNAMSILKELKKQNPCFTCQICHTKTTNPNTECNVCFTTLRPFKS